MLSKAEFRGAFLALGGVLLVILLIVSISPNIPGALLLQSLRFHLAAVGIVLAVLAIWMGARWRGLLGLLLVLGSFGQGAQMVWELYARREMAVSAPQNQFRFLSFNVLNGNDRAAELVDAILADPPDVALIMETPGIEAYLDRLATVFPYRVGCENTRTCDISLHSRFPMADAKVQTLPPFGYERLVTGRIEVGGAAVTLVGVHLSKPYFDTASLHELWVLDQALNEIEGPVVLSGDFNSAPWSDPVAEVAARQDLAIGAWTPATWPVRLGPLGVPIDNMFTRGAAQIMSLESGDNYGSNHRPLWATIGLYPTD